MKYKLILASLFAFAFLLIIQTTNAAAPFKCPLDFVCSQKTSPVRDVIGTVTPQPTLTLTYNSSRNEAALTAVFKIAVTGGKSGAVVYGNASGVLFFNQNGNITLLQSQNNSPLIPLTKVQTISDGLQSIYIVPKNSTVVFQETGTVDPRALLPGSYYATMQKIYASLPNSPAGTEFSVPIGGLNKTNSVTIVGEVAPFIDSVSPNPVLPGQIFTIRGQRLSGAQPLIDNAQLSNVIYGGPTDGSSLTFNMPSIAEGWHWISLHSNFGDSNSVGFQVQSSSTVNLPVVSNTAASLGAPIVNNLGVTMSYPVSFKYTISAGNQTIYVPSLAVNSNGMVANGLTSTFSNSLNPDPAVLAGDTASNYVIPAGASRTFVLMGNVSNAGNNVPAYLKITSIYYTLNTGVAVSQSITSGLENLILYPSFSGTLTACPAGYTCYPTPPTTPQVSNCPVGYTCVITSIPTLPSLKVSIDPSSPIENKLSAGQTGVTFAVIDLITSSSSVSTMDSIQVASDLSTGNLLSNIKVYSGGTLLGSASNLVNNGSYYYRWISISGLNIPANTSLPIRITADVPSTNANIRAGIAGLNFQAPGAVVTGLPVYGSQMTVVCTTLCSTSPTITPVTSSTQTSSIWDAIREYFAGTGN